ncbi:tripartite motif-containing protein 16-like [Labeo rohita]|uniref:tripartite motif-containing protein 16-like n=1 Tax=Labeo rohita TaxID=84645 RepID=UPI0021E26921|nr:tripartite motif-containing protein 16-like [Labeo rohita]
MLQQTSSSRSFTSSSLTLASQPGGTSKKRGNFRGLSQSALSRRKSPKISSCSSSFSDCWNQEDQMRVYSCPQCKQTFSPRPALATNTMLTEQVEKLKETKLPADCYAGAGDVQCDACTGSKYKAVKSCLMCQESYCQTHFDHHEKFHSRKPHKVIDATGRLQEMICQKHEKNLEMYCITDQQCICELCTKYEHKNHNTVSAAAQRTEKQKQLKKKQKMFQLQIQQEEKDLQQLREAVESHKRSAQTAVEDSERIYTEFNHSIERSCFELLRLLIPDIRDQAKAAVNRAEGRLERLEQEINDLRRRDAELEQLLHTQDHIQFLQRFQSLSAPPESTDENDDPFSSVFSFGDLKESVDQLRDKLEDFCKEELKKISDKATSTRISNNLLQYSHQLTLDLNTMNKHLRLSESNRVITYTRTVQSYPDHPDKFDVYYQVLCRESVCGRCYWELEWSGNNGVYISVSYKSISRKGRGKECLFGNNDQSWSLICTPSSYSFGHNNIQTALPVKSISSRIGVFVDHSAGTLSFYSVSDTMSLIHTVQTKFTQPLYPGFRVSRGSSVKMVMN